MNLICTVIVVVWHLVIICAIEEARELEQAYINAKENVSLPDMLTVITGRSEMKRDAPLLEKGTGGFRAQLGDTKCADRELLPTCVLIHCAR